MDPISTLLIGLTGGALIGVAVSGWRYRPNPVDTAEAEAALAEAQARQERVDRVIADNEAAVAKLRAALDGERLVHPDEVTR